MGDSDTHDYVLLEWFLKCNSVPCRGDSDISCLNGDATGINKHSDRSIGELSKIVHTVQNHGYERSIYDTMKMLLERDKLRNDTVQRLLSCIVEKCSFWLASSPKKST